MVETPDTTAVTDDYTGKLLAENLARFLKAFSIYPENSKRVHESMDALLTSVAQCRENEHLAPSGSVRLMFEPGMLYVGGEETEIQEDSVLDWLEERFDAALLAGIDLSSAVSADSMKEFARQFLDNQTRTQLDDAFEQLWEDTYTGIELVERHFGGFFTHIAVDGKPGMGGGGIQGVAGGVAANAQAGMGLTLDFADERALAEHLAKADSIREQVERIQSMFEAQTEEGEQTAGIDLLSRIVKLMPAEAMRDMSKVIELAEGVLTTVASNLAKEAGQDEEQPVLDELEALGDDRGIKRMLFVASRRLFGREGPTASELSVKLEEQDDPGLAPARRAVAPITRASDDLIQDDEALFFKELQELPPLALHEATVHIEYPPEQIGVYLYFLVRFDDARRFRALYPPLERLLSAPGKEDLAVLGAYLVQHDEDEERWQTRRKRIVRFLVTVGRGSLMRACGLLPVDQVAEEFPKDFVLFLHALDYDSAADMGVLKQLLIRVGKSALEEHAEELLRVQGLNQWLLPDKLLAQPIPQLLPLAQELLRTGGDEVRPLIVRYLRAIGLERPEACLLWILRDPMEIPRRYLFRLLALIAAEGDGEGEEDRAFVHGHELPALISREVCRFLRRSDGNVAEVERRAYAMRFLGTFRTPEAAALLTEVLQGRRFYIVSKEPRVILRVAKQALKEY